MDRRVTYRAVSEFILLRHGLAFAMTCMQRLTKDSHQAEHASSFIRKGPQRRSGPKQCAIGGDRSDGANYLQKHDSENWNAGEPEYYIPHECFSYGETS
jgi:hypothetical protein